MKISEAKLRAAVRNLLFEDSVTSGAHRMSTDDKVAGTLGDDRNELDDTPVKPTELMANTIAIEKPPIDDEDFMPVNSSELSRAGAAMLDFVADDQVAFVYKNLQNLILKAEEQAREIETVEPQIDDVEPIETPVSKTGDDNE